MKRQILWARACALYAVARWLDRLGLHHHAGRAEHHATIAWVLSLHGRAWARAQR